MKNVLFVFKAVFLAALVAYLVIFAVSNLQEASLTFFMGVPPVSMPMFMFSILTVFLGFLIGIIVMTSSKISSSLEIKGLKKKLEEAEKEINRLKNILVTEKESEKNIQLQKTETLPTQGEQKESETNAAVNESLR